MQEMQTLPRAQESSLDLREFGSMERLHWLLGKNHPNHFVMAAEVSGATTVDMWREALDELQRRHPLLNVSIGRNAESNLVYRQAAGHKIPLIVKRRISPLQWQEEFGRELATPLYDDTPPLMRAILLEGDDRCEIILVTHHTIADGMSLIFVIRDLLQALSGKKLTPLPLPPSQEERIAEVWTAPPSPSPAPASNGNASAPPAARQLSFSRIEDGKRPRVRGLRLSQEQTSLLVEATRREGATVHTALCTAFVLAGREISPLWRDDVVRLLSPMSLRKMLNAGEDCALITRATALTFASHREMAFWDWARWVKQALLPAQTLASAADSRIFDYVLAANDDDEVKSRLQALGGYDLAVSNLQRVPFESKFGDFTVEAIWGPSILNGIEGEQLIGAATVNNSLCLVHTSYTPLDSFLERAVDIAMKACGSAEP
jgi:hypothetical protein